MKRLTFIRHAKSDWENAAVQDIDRHLNERGYADAYNAATWYAENKSVPDALVSSTATRALNTALIFARTLQFNMNRFYLENNLYEIKLPVLLQLIQNFDKDFNHLALFGHNPATTNVCNELASDWYIDNVPTCGIVSLTFDIQHWKELEANTGKVDYYRFPKEYKQ